MPLAMLARLRRTLDGVQCSPQHGLRVWGLILVVLLASLTQAGVPLALHGADGSGPGSRQAASDIIYICTGSGIQPVRLSSIGDGQTGIPATLASDGDDTRSGGKPAASHAFCAHCAFCHVLPVVMTGFWWSHPVGQIRFVVFPVGVDARYIMASYGFDARGPPVVPA
ncbi:hypothetical protein LF95_02290 [Thalassospira sp. TSL5-1]|nr:hypothetical protein LF95_02290 [Thalassospira sp. TSL5-1]